MSIKLLYKKQIKKLELLLHCFTPPKETHCAFNEGVDFDGRVVLLEQVKTLSGVVHKFPEIISICLDLTVGTYLFFSDLFHDLCVTLRRPKTIWK